mmetsp:Transcript_102260/g.312791  ORF Transcript_102260/g.312791 Transcript_102260/m.312791 type:complete len:280 (-) Transcript_102260:514-1353(-)
MALQIASCMRWVGSGLRRLGLQRLQRRLSLGRPAPSLEEDLVDHRVEPLLQDFLHVNLRNLIGAKELSNGGLGAERRDLRHDPVEVTLQGFLALGQERAAGQIGHHPPEAHPLLLGQLGQAAWPQMTALAGLDALPQLHVEVFEVLEAFQVKHLAILHRKAPQLLFGHPLGAPRYKLQQGIAIVVDADDLAPHALAQLPERLRDDEAAARRGRPGEAPAQRDRQDAAFLGLLVQQMGEVRPTSHVVYCDDQVTRFDLARLVWLHRIPLLREAADDLRDV